MFWKSFRSINETKLVGLGRIAQCAERPCESHFFLAGGAPPFRGFLGDEVGGAPPAFRVVWSFSPARRGRRSRASRGSWTSRTRVGSGAACDAGNFRHDGKLLTAGDEKGNVKLFDVETKTMLRQAQPHSSAVHAVEFFSTTQLLSGSDDKTICLYDIPTNMVVNTYAGHSVGAASGSRAGLRAIAERGGRAERLLRERRLRRLREAVGPPRGAGGGVRAVAGDAARGGERAAAERVGGGGGERRGAGGLRPAERRKVREREDESDPF